MDSVKCVLKWKVDNTVQKRLFRLNEAIADQGGEHKVIDIIDTIKNLVLIVIAIVK